MAGLLGVRFDFRLGFGCCLCRLLSLVRVDLLQVLYLDVVVFW